MQIRLMTTHEHLLYKKPDIAALKLFSVNYLISLKTAVYIINKFNQPLLSDILSQ